MATLGNRLVREIVDRLGVEEASARLNLSPASLASFKSDRPVPEPIMLKVIDLIESLRKESPQ